MADLKNYQNIGEYKHFTRCRFCESEKVVEVINLGMMPLAGGFLKNKKAFKSEHLYPLNLVFCKKCFTLQVNSSINPDTLFKDYFYFSSSIKTLVDHFKKTVEMLITEFGLTKEKFVVEIGCNDGEFIKALTSNGIKALGVDPATNVVKPLIKKGLPIINEYFSSEIAAKIVKQYGKADTIASFHSMAHIENMPDVFEGIKKLLKNDGFLSMEVHYLVDLLEGKQYDMIYHEHQFYYSIVSLRNILKQFELEIFDVKKSNVRAGSITFFIQHKNGPKNKTKNYKSLLKYEMNRKINKAETYIKFAKLINKEKIKLTSLLNKLIKRKKTIIGYGASGRGTIIANYCELQPYLSYVVDDAKAKHGSFLPGTHHEIFPSSKMINDKIDYAVLFAWPFYKEVREKNKNFKGKFIVPLPILKIV